MKQKKIHLTEQQLPENWYNIVADMPNRPLPPLHPATGEPVSAGMLRALFPDGLIEQETSTQRFIPIPEEVRDEYAAFRPSPLIRATEFEKALETDCRIYFKYEGNSPSGSHKTNTAIPQAYYNAREGVRKLTTETGAGQWGTALSYACNRFGLECEVFMVRSSFNQKPYRKTLMNLYGATVHPSPGLQTSSGRKALDRDPETPGNLGIAISEAIETALAGEATKYSLGSVLNHVLLHQTIIGEEALKQLEIAGDFPDIVIAPLGGGSNFAGIAFPLLRHVLAGERQVRCIAVESASCPKLTRGKFLYDFGDMSGFTPLLPMFTLGHDFQPPTMHAGGLRYHGASALCSQLLLDGLIEAAAVNQRVCFEAGMLFARTEGIVPAPESTHAIAQVLNEVETARAEGISRTLLFNLSGHGHLDLSAYEAFMLGRISDEVPTDSDIAAGLKNVHGLQPVS